MDRVDSCAFSWFPSTYLPIKEEAHFKTKILRYHIKKKSINFLFFFFPASMGGNHICLLIFNQISISQINSTWSWYIIFIVGSWIQYTNILLNIFVSIGDIYNFLSIVFIRLSYQYYIYKLYKNNLEVFFHCICSRTIYVALELSSFWKFGSQDWIKEQKIWNNRLLLMKSNQ